MNDKSISIFTEKLDSGFVVTYDGKRIAMNTEADVEDFIIRKIKSSFWFHGNGVMTTQINYSAQHNPPKQG